LRRRDFVGSTIGTTVVWPWAAAAQSKPVPGKIGYLHPVTLVNNTLVLLKSAWRERGYVEGESVFLRSAEGDSSRLPHLVAELIALQVGVLIVVGAPAVQAASRATKAVPIVAIDLETDPVHAGYAASLSRPGGNVTGLFMELPSLAGKWIQLLREAAPGIRRVAVIWDKTTGHDQLDTAIEAAKAVGLEATVVESRSPADYEGVFARLQQEQPTGLVLLTAPGIVPTLSSITSPAIAHKLPTIAFLKYYAMNGALLSYGPVVETYFPRSVILADRILRGEKPGNLPIERPAKFELVLNLRTAKAMGLTIPQPLVERADEVIE
jgi:putative ABC transport system substrate-binding protein